MLHYSRVSRLDSLELGTRNELMAERRARYYKWHRQSVFIVLFC